LHLGAGVGSAVTWVVPDVLSVWKLGHGHEAYYLDAVAAGVEDYYVGGEAPGRWVASGRTQFGLEGDVDADDLRAVLSGCDPRSGTRLGQPHTVPGFDLTSARRQLETSEQRAERLQREITAVDASQHRRTSYLATHHADRLQLGQIERQLDDRLRTQVNRVIKEPPNYIIKTLGPRPHNTATDRVWVRTVIEIEKHRLEHGITDQRTPIGPEPVDFAAHNNWQRVSWTIEDAIQSVTPCVAGAERTPAPARGPELGISL
jgi:hypothetical protein